MRLFKLLAPIATAAALLCGPVLADDQPVGGDPQKIAAARARADDAITRLGVGDFFENASEGEMARVRHKASRMTCMIAGPTFEIVFAEGAPKGDDVTCVGGMLGPESQRAVRYAKAPPLEAALAQAVRSLGGEIDKMKPYRGTAVSATASLSEAMPLTTARFTGRQDGKPVYARVTVFIDGDWVYVHKLIVPAELKDAAELLAELQLVMEMIEMMRSDGSAGQ